MKLLVTGGAGFIGSNFIRFMLTTHDDVSIINLDALTYAGNLENVAEFENSDRYEFVKGDICDKDTVFPLVERVDAVVHFAAESHVDRSIEGPGIFLRTNIIGTQIILDAVKEYDKRLHHVSTDEVFGTLEPHDPPFTEDTPYDPRSPYSASKAAADHLVRAYITTYGIKATISNCSNNYGPYMFPEKFIPLMISNVMEGKTIPVYGDGQQIRDWIHVDDHNRGVDMILRQGTLGETYVLGGKDAEITNLTLAKTVLSILGKDESLLEFVKDRPGHDRRYAVDYTKAKEQLGWEPTVSLESGLQAMVNWYQDHPEWVARCKSGEYREYYEKQYGA